MTRPSKLDRLISFQHGTDAVDEFGTATTAWETFKETRAELVTTSFAENARAFGEAETATVVFRLRYVPGLTTADRLLFDGSAFNIRAVQETGRRTWLEVMAEALK